MEQPMTETTSSPTSVDLYSSSSFAVGHPHEQYRWLRDNRPVYPHPAPDGGHFWAVMRHGDIRTVERSYDTYSTDPCVTIETGVLPRHFLAMDDPEHSALRRLVAPELVLSSVRNRVPELREIAALVVDDVSERGTCDLVGDVAGPIAGIVAAELLGISRADGRRINDLMTIIHGSSDVHGREKMAAALEAVFDMARQAYRDRRANPRADVLTTYAFATIDGEPITEDQFLGSYLLLTDGSLDTARNVIGTGMFLLFQHPDQRERLVADLDVMLPAAVEEMLRAVSPVVYIRRVARHRVELGGETIEAGDRVVVYLGSGNHDERVFDDPETFDITRTPNDHLAFGAGGPHFCVGYHLGRAEIRATLREIFTRLPDIEQTGAQEWVQKSISCGLRSLPVRFTPAPRKGQHQ
jgi:cytochrome P450